MRAEKGAVTAEFAMVLPSVVLLMLILFGAIGIALEAIGNYQQMSTAAVLIGRGDAVPEAAKFSVSTGAGMVCVANPDFLLITEKVCAIDYR